VELDITYSEHIAAVAQGIQERYGRLDVLVNNAGSFFDHLGNTTDMMRQSFEVNVIGAHALIEALLPLLEASPEGRIVNQSSILASIDTILTNDFFSKSAAPGYTTSKAALNALTAQLSIRLKDTNIKGECNASRLGKNRYGWRASSNGDS
jgi:NAD(P)-dependent dehydrogenase (short-subunit alcohol dehydrogenase family)